MGFNAIKYSIIKYNNTPSNSRFRLYKRHFLILCAFILITIFIYFTQINVIKDNEAFKDSTNISLNRPHFKYLIDTSTCKIPDVDPFNDEVKKYFYKERYTKCSNLDLLSYIEKNDSGATLRINLTVLPQYETKEIFCCYNKILRIKIGNNTDNAFRMSTPCVSFLYSVNITHPFINVICMNVDNKVIYNNVHATALPTPAQKRAIEQTSYKSRPFSILLVGIDSISKLNLMRTMPKTHQFLEQNFLNLKGYNKVADNTFPNLMAILTGRSKTQVYQHCKPDTLRMEKCDFIWKRLKNFRYVTAYGEDECTIGTFNYQDWGFDKEPVDFYYRPYMLAAEKLPIVKRYGMKVCTGPESSGERIMNAAKDFAITFQNLPNFGLFWMNSFSHDNINLAASMDEKVLDFLSDTSFRSSLNDTILVFFSDHGFRFGNIRYTHTGWLEERLPFIYLHLPKRFKDNFPKEFEIIQSNSQRLTTPYDLHVTLQDLVHLTDKNFEVIPSKACPLCRSMFQQVFPPNRTCEDAAIDQHWCTCKMHNYINPKNQKVLHVAQFVVQEINNFTSSFSSEVGFCAKYYLRNVVSAGKSEVYLNKNGDGVSNFLVILETIPNAMFEATVAVSTNAMKTTFKLLGEMSRVNRYAENSYCVKSSALKKYCYCDGFVTSIKSAICITLGYCS